MGKRNFRKEINPLGAVRVPRYGYVCDWIIDECQQLPRRGSILRPLRT